MSDDLEMRDALAVEITTAILRAAPDRASTGAQREELARESYSVADAMIAARGGADVRESLRAFVCSLSDEQKHAIVDGLTDEQIEQLTALVKALSVPTATIQ
jgi:hypothetical protein